MKTNNISYELIKYAGAVHSFTEKGAGNNPKNGAAYNARADSDSFSAAAKFLRNTFR